MNNSDFISRLLVVVYYMILVPFGASVCVSASFVFSFTFASGVGFRARRLKPFLVVVLSPYFVILREEYLNL